jgi:hypothetical protein
MRSRLLQQHNFRLGIVAVKGFPLAAAPSVRRATKCSQRNEPDDPARLIQLWLLREHVEVTID